MRTSHSLFTSGRPRLRLCASRGDFSSLASLRMREEAASQQSEPTGGAAHPWPCLEQPPFILTGSVGNTNPEELIQVLLIFFYLLLCLENKINLQQKKSKQNRHLL